MVASQRQPEWSYLIGRRMVGARSNACNKIEAAVNLRGPYRVDTRLFNSSSEVGAEQGVEA